MSIPSQTQVLLATAAFPSVAPSATGNLYRQLTLPLAVACAVLTMTGCGGGDGGTPTDVAQGVRALAAAPGEPTSTVGQDGSYYLDTTTRRLYGPKANGAWPTASIMLSGTAVLNGSGAPDDAQGNDGEFYINTGDQKIYGPKANGVWPAEGVSLVGPMGPSGANGVNGTNGTNGNTLLSGTAAPNLGIGAVGDFFIDTATSTLYGPKTSTSWPAGVSLKGASGNGLLSGTGAPIGGAGTAGDFYLDTTTTTLFGPKTASGWPSSGVSLVGAAGTNGSNGANGTNGLNGNSVLNGGGIPSSSTGTNGDFYIDTTTTTLYGPKAAGVWPSAGVSMVGTEGATGATGATGAAGTNGNSILNGTSLPSNAIGVNGDFYLNTATTTLYGPKAAGAWPSIGVSLIGPAGATGATGATGTAGTNGTNGTNGNTILNGTGVPASSTGANGDFYIDTATTTLYGPKSAGVWPGTGVALIGSGGGASGNTLLNGTGQPSNSTGNNGDFYIDTASTTLYGPKLSGTWGAGVSLVGATGATGATGPAGATGATGATGAAGTNGNRIFTGSGTPGAGTGSDGDIYIQTGTGLLFGPKASGSWGAGVALTSSSGGTGVTLQLNATANAKTSAIGSSLSLPEVLAFENTITSPSASAGTWTANNTFTVAPSGAALYQINVQLMSNSIACVPMIDMNGTGYSGSSYYGTSVSLAQTSPTGYKHRGTINVVVPLVANDSFQIRYLSASTAIGCDLQGNGSSWVRVVKLN